ncbi:MAG: tetratricopeptide repeat protein [Acidimicrobiales bacterium]
MSDLDRSSEAGRSERATTEILTSVATGDGGCFVVHGRLPDGAVPDVPGTQALALRATPDERLLAYVGLSELCRPLTALLDLLPPVQAAALAGALALGPPKGDSLAVAIGFRSLLSVAAERGPLVIVVEDAHLLDRGSASALAYVARRLDGIKTTVLISQDPTHHGALELPSATVLTGLGAASSDADRRVVDDVERAVRRARSRASDADLAAALELGAGAGPGPERWAALLEAGRAWLDAGRTERAREVVGRLQDEVDGAWSAPVAMLSGRVALAGGDMRLARDQLREATRQATPDDPATAVAALLLLVPDALFGGHPAVAEETLAEAEFLLGELDHADPALRHQLVAAQTAVALATGRSTDIAPIVHLLADADAAPAAGDVSLLVSTVALPLIWRERHDLAVPLLVRAIDELRARGAVGALAMPLCALSVAERRRGRISRALVLATEARDLAAETSQRVPWLFAHVELANAYSLLGDPQRCRAAAAVVIDGTGDRPGLFRSGAVSALATAEVWAGDPARAVTLLEPLVQTGPLDPSVLLFQHTLAVAYALVGRPDDAQPLVDELARTAPPDDGRLRAVLARCEALVAPGAERLDRLEQAADRSGADPLAQAFTRLLHARCLLADGATARAVEVLHELADEASEDLVGPARCARVLLVGLGRAPSDPAWALLDPAELAVARASAEGAPALVLADQLRLSPPEVDRLRDGVAAALGVRTGPGLEAALARPASRGGAEAPIEIRLVGGLAVEVGGRCRPVPSGAAATTVAVVALRRAIHVEELTTILWPDADAEVARRRLRNVLARVRKAVDVPLVVREGNRLELAPEAVVDHHLLERQASRVLAMEPGPARRAALVEAVANDQGPLLPEARYDEWALPAQRRTEVRRADLADALARDPTPGAPAGADQTCRSARRSRS